MFCKDKSITSRVALAIVASVVTMTAVAQAPAKRPALVVGIMVDGLRSEYIELLKGYFTEGGFKRMMRDGVVLENVEYGNGVDAAAATAMIYTGAPASVNGIPSSVVYDPENKRSYPILLDPTKIGNYTDETYSPGALLVSTLADEIRIDDNGMGYVYSVSPDAIQSILMTGHAGNSAFWINDVSGKWATTTYYKDVPAAIQSRNLKTPLSSRLDTLSWIPSMPLEQYPDLATYKRYYPFRHMFLRKDKDRYRNYKQSAPVNAEVTSVATDYITGMSLGKRGTMDMLNIGYTLEPFPQSKDADHRLEMMDSYIRLDRNLQQLFSAIDRNVGMENTLVFLAGTPVQSNGKRDDEKWGIPYGEFLPRRAVSLLNMYLMAIYGNGDWVNGYHNGQFFLNHKLIKERDKNVKEMRAEAAGFLARMSGVSEAFTIDDITSGNSGINAQARKRNTHLAHAGDVFVTVNPGWETVEDDGETEKRTVSRINALSSPVFIMAPELAPQRIGDGVDALAISPTIARLLRIRSPNAASLSPLHLK